MRRIRGVLNRAPRGRSRALTGRRRALTGRRTASVDRRMREAGDAGFSLLGKEIPP
ncbi:hypothetical protein [Actinomadura rupiterrae]|uniref:hypothetical protein n=1 Tax=Actinomadura rupiterrae TaxID=559627 RepID=UPI0020A352A3|nr:hypothetical protein [Actinomadura rupiterrae]MCP2337475.1 hypothetical protein [Actinomadura rupiterrae]